MQIALLQNRVASNAFDGEAWELLIDELWALREQPGVQDTLKTALETIVKQYPTAVRSWPHCTSLNARKCTQTLALSDTLLLEAAQLLCTDSSLRRRRNGIALISAAVHTPLKQHHQQPHAQSLLTYQELMVSVKLDAGQVLAAPGRHAA